MANLLDILKKPTQKVKQTIGSLFSPRTPTPTTPILPPRSSQIQIPQKQVNQVPTANMTSTSPFVSRDITMDEIFKTDRIGTPVTFKETLEHLPTLKEQPKLIASSISMAAEKFLPTRLYKSLDTRFHITDKLVEADKAIVQKSQSLQKALGLNYLSQEHVDSIFEELTDEYSQFSEEIGEIKEKNPTARAVAHFGGELMNFAMISRIFAGATPVVQKSLMKTKLGTSLSQSMWGLTTLRAISSAASSVPTHATVRSLEEAADQIAEGEFSPTRILGAMARGGLQGALLATAHALPTNPWRIGTAGLFGGSWVTLETLIKNGQVTKEDIPSIAKNAVLWMAFEAINSIGLTRAYESELQANRAKWVMAEKYGKDVADLVNKLDYLEIMYGSKNTELGQTFRDLKNKVIAHEMYHRDVQYIRTGKGEAITLSEHLTPSEKAILAHLDSMTGEVAPISMKIFEKDPIVQEAAINQPDIITRIDSQTAQIRPEIRAEVPLETSLKAVSGATPAPALSMGDILQVPPGLSSKVTPPAEVVKEELPQSKLERPTETARKIAVSEERAVTPETPETTIVPAEKVTKEPASLEPSNEVELREAEELMKMGDIFKGEGAEEMTMTTEKKIAEIIDNEMARVEYEVLAEMEISEAKSAFRTEEGYIHAPSTFPDWVPEKLRSRKLFDKVAEHIKNETVPSEKYTKQKELYDVIQEEMSQRVNKDLLEETKAEKILLEIAKQSPTRAGIIKKLIPPSAQKILGAEPAPFVKMRETTLLKNKIKNFARGSREGSLYTRKQIVDKQKEFANILKESGLTAKDQSKFITEMRDIAKSPEPEINFYNKFPDIQRRIERLLDAQTKRDLSSAIDREFKYTKPLKKGDKRVAKYEYEYNKQIEELRSIRKLTQEKAQAKLDELDVIRGGKVEDISEFELIKERIYSLQANGVKASVEIYEKVLEDIQRLKKAGEEAKNIEDFFKKIERAERVDEINNKIIQLRPSELRDVGFIKKSMNAIASGYHSGISNIGSYLNQIVGKDLSDKYDPSTKQNRMDTSYTNKGEEINKKAIKILELRNDRTLMKRFVDMAKDKIVMTDIDGVNHDINKLELIDIYNSVKNDVVKERYYWAYSKAQVDSALSNLTDSEKMLGDMLMTEVQNYREILNKRNIEITGRDMGTVENYWPGTTEHQPSVFDDIKIQGETPSALKARSHSTRLIPIPTNAWTKGTKHIKIAEHVNHLSREYETLRRIFTDRKVKGSIVNRYGDRIYRDLLRHIDSISLNREVAITNIVDGVFNKALNNWVSAKMFSPTVFARQLGSTTNYMRHMPATEWTVGFMKGVATPRKTAEYMLKRFDFIPARFNRGHDEAARDAITGGNHLKVNADSWRAIGTLPTRTGDITAIIYGGRPYVEYLDKEAAKKGLKGQEAEDYVRDKFERVTLKEQQFGGSTGLSLPQQSAGATKAFFRFRNTANQYTRVLVDTTLQYKRGEVSAGFLGKTYFHYALLQPLLYTLIGAGVVGGYKAIVRGVAGKSKKKDKDANLAADTLIFTATQPFTAVPFLGEGIEYTIRKKAGLPSYSMISTPMLDDIERGFQSAFKKEPTLEDYLRFVAAVEEPALGFPMATFLTYYRYAKEELEEPKKKSGSEKSMEQLRKEAGLPSLTDDVPTTKSSGKKSMDQLRKEAGLPPLY